MRLPAYKGEEMPHREDRGGIPAATQERTRQGWERGAKRLPASCMCVPS